MLEKNGVNEKYFHGNLLFRWGWYLYVREKVWHFRQHFRNISKSFKFKFKFKKWTKSLYSFMKQSLKQGIGVPIIH